MKIYQEEDMSNDMFTGDGIHAPCSGNFSASMQA